MAARNSIILPLFLVVLCCAMDPIDFHKRFSKSHARNIAAEAINRARKSAAEERVRKSTLDVLAAAEKAPPLIRSHWWSFEDRLRK